MFVALIYGQPVEGSLEVVTTEQMVTEKYGRTGKQVYTQGLVYVYWILRI